MALLGFYVGVIPVALGMLWLPWVRRIPRRWLRGVMALTVGLLGFLAIDATLEGLELAGDGLAGVRRHGARRSSARVVAYLLLSGVSALARATRRAARRRARRAGGRRWRCWSRSASACTTSARALAIGAAYAVGALALGAFLVVGFALHNTTEGLAIVAPLARRAPVARRGSRRSA